eukprot:scaffold827_cov369-Prasinococcus_capsulatus_cf.AAC.22
MLETECGAGVARCTGYLAVLGCNPGAGRDGGRCAGRRNGRGAAGCGGSERGARRGGRRTRAGLRGRRGQRLVARGPAAAQCAEPEPECVLRGDLRQQDVGRLREDCGPSQRMGHGS